jgi:electron transfer flavoprotein alpha subunit
MSDHRVGGAFDYVIRLEGDALESHDAVAAASCIEELHEDHGFNAILIPATPFGRMLAPRAAMRLRVGLVADVTGIRRRGDEVEMVRPAFSGRMLAGVVSVGPGPLMMTVRRNVFSAAHRGLKPTTMLYHGPRTPHGSRVRLVERRERDVSSDIRESDVLVSGGGGVERSFDRLEALARALGGMVSASRKVVDSGTAPRRIQVGQSGRTVSPRLYLALGISGSIQHVVGLKSAEHVIAVNTDRHAPICALSDIVVEGDAREFIPRLLERIEQGAPAASNTARGEAR